MNIIPTGVGSLIRFLVGIFLLQGVTGLLVYTALSTDWATTWPLFLLLAGSIGTLVAFWFNTIVAADRHRTVSRISERFSKEREKIRVKAEQIRAKVGRDNARLEAKVRTRGSMGANLKTGVVVGGAVGLGVAMMLAQFVTLGLLTLTTAGGVALGYTARVRQEKSMAARRLAEEERMLMMMEADPPRRSLPGKKASRAEIDTE
jgi:Flp pilus assembly protein TadB